METPDLQNHVLRPAAHASEVHELVATIAEHGVPREIAGRGNGPLDAMVNALSRALGRQFSIVDYREHAIGQGADAAAIAYVEMRCGDRTRFGVARHVNILTASLQALVSAVNRLS